MWNADEYARTLDFAATAHASQKVPGSGFPYVVHVVKVAAEVMRAYAERPDFDARLAVTCALLHDCVEDAGVTHAVLSQRFGLDVANGVAALTKDATIEKARRMEDSLSRLLAQPTSVQLVKLADRITNLEEPPPDWTAAKRSAYRDEAKRILEVLGGANDWLARRLESRLGAYARFLDPTA